MKGYTILAAKYVRANSAAVLLQTVESGAVLVTEKDRPQLWAHVQQWVNDGGSIAPTDSPTKDQVNAPLLTQIAALELKAHRAGRECLLGKGDLLDIVLGKTPKQRLQELEDQIDALRGQLVKEL